MNEKFPEFTPSPALSPMLIAPKVPLIHRDLSWLQFNSRVLAEALDPSNPLLERFRFLSISASNLDEFFMIRFASLSRQISAANRLRKESEARQLGAIRSAILRTVSRLNAKQADTLLHLSNEARKAGVQFVVDPNPKGKLAEIGKELFESRITPIIKSLEPQPIRALRQLRRLELGLVLRDEAWLPIPRGVPATVWKRDPQSGDCVVFFSDHLIIRHLPSMIRPGVSAIGLVRVTRDTDYSFDLEEEDPQSIPDVILSELSASEYGTPQRLQSFGKFPSQTVRKALSVLKLGQAQAYTAPRTLCLHGLWSTVSELKIELTDKPKLFFPKFAPALSKAFELTEGIFETLKARDILLHHPYDSFDAYVRWIQKACSDPDVKMVELTIYRTDSLSPLIETLKGAARSKRVRVIIELRARFDELNNLQLATELRNAGVEVTFGFGKLKVHAKLTLVTRSENGTSRHYTHVATGNYNSKTARQYTDLGVLTSDETIGHDARMFFDAMWKGEVPTQFKALVPAPARLHRRVSSLIETEIKAAKEGKPAKIFAKVNALVDPGTIESLYRASQAGVKVELVVRGACSLIPGVKGLSDNIRVISIIDRFLEHSRIFSFQNSQVIYLSSADWMPRNFFSRLEIAFPVRDAAIYRFLEEVVFPAYMSDNQKSHELTSRGTWRKIPQPSGAEKVRSQQVFMELATRGYEGTPIGYGKDTHHHSPRSSIQDPEPGGG